jgi:general stress protein 26
MAELPCTLGSYFGMTAQDSTDRIWDIIEKVGVCMLTTRFPGGLRARPVEARPDPKAGLIFFVTDLRSGKEHEIEAEHDVGLVFIDHKDKAYLSITATAQVLRDHAKAREIWKTTDDMWWKGPADPNVCVLRVQPLTAELWDGPASKALAAYEFAKAKLTGEKPNLGENRKVTVRMERQQVPTNLSSPVNKPSKNYRLLWRAVRTRRPIIFAYNGRPREACPVILGYSKAHREAVKVYQTGGETSQGKLPDWRDFFVDEISGLKLTTGKWLEGASHKRAQKFVQKVDVDANIPDSLTRPAPLPFGSPELRAPRTSP